MKVLHRNRDQPKPAAFLGLSQTHQARWNVVRTRDRHMKLTLEPLQTRISCTDLPDVLSEEYAKHIRRLFRVASRRCAMSLRPKTLSELGTQLCLRALLLRQSKMSCELAALRNLISLMKSRREHFHDAGMEISPVGTIPDLPAAHPWIRSTNWSEVEKFRSFLISINCRRLFDRGVEVIDDLVEDRQMQGDFRSPGDIWVSLTSVAWRLSFDRRRNSPKDNWEPLSEEHMREIDAHMPPGTPEEGLLSLNAKKRNYFGIARLLTRTAWLTGVRSCEIFTSRLMELDPEPGLSEAQIKKAYRNPIAAIASGLFRDIEAPYTRDGRETKLNEWHFLPDSRSPAILVIRTAKTTNSSPRIDNTLRVQILDGISVEEIHLLWLASRFRTPHYCKVCTKVLCDRSNRILKQAVRELYPERALPVTLHILRHAFADLARKTMRPAAVAALTGHTSVRTLRGYGGKNVRYGRKHSSSRWMPQPDPTRVRENARAWRPRVEAAVEPNLETFPFPELVME